MLKVTLVSPPAGTSNNAAHTATVHQQLGHLPLARLAGEVPQRGGQGYAATGGDDRLPLVRLYAQRGDRQVIGRRLAHVQHVQRCALGQSALCRWNSAVAAAVMCGAQLARCKSVKK